MSFAPWILVRTRRRDGAVQRGAIDTEKGAVCQQIGAAIPSLRRITLWNGFRPNLITSSLHKPRRGI